MSLFRCGGCGAEFRLDSTLAPTTCPLCGAQRLREVMTSSTSSVERYQAEVRRLRRLKDSTGRDSEAV